MKRSKALSLILMGTLAVGTAGCGTDKADETMYSFTSLDECVTSAIFSEAECKDLARNALAQTPKFASLAECEAQFGAGACSSPSAQPGQEGQPGAGAGQGTQVQQHSGGFWMPMMMGFMAGRFMGGGGLMQGSQGLYRDPGAGSQTGGDRSFRTATGDTVKADPKGRVTNPSPRMTQSMSHNAKPAMSRAGGASRGGFSGGGAMGGAAS